MIIVVYHKQECQRLQDEISLLEKELSLMPNYDEVYPVVPIYRFKKRKQIFDESQKYFILRKKILELKSKLAEVNRDLSPEEFKILVKERKLVLTEEDKTVLYNSSDFKSLSELCLVHKCDYMPFNNEIKSALNSGAESVRSFRIGSETYEYKHKEQRNTVHFSANGEVGSHDLGNWDVRRYAIIVPFECLVNYLISARSCDSFVRDKALLNDKCYILCPKEEVEKVRNDNNLVNVIPYEGNNVSGYANAVISFLGYKCESISNHGWLGDDQSLYEKLMRKHNLSMLDHMSTKDYNCEIMKKSYTHILEIYLRLFMPDVEIDLSLLEDMQKEPYGDHVYSNLRFYISEFIYSSIIFNDAYSRDKTILFLIKLLNDLSSINPNFSFETDFEALKSKFFANYYDPIEPFINEVLKSLFKSVIEKPKKVDIDHNEDNIKNLPH